eukprot:symbB.v1.2.031566.t1/scaffold3637.1/size52925/4
MAPLGFGRKPKGSSLSASCGNLMPQKMQAASLRFGTTLTMRPVSRPSSASQAATLVRRAVEVAEEKVEKDKLDPGKLFPPKARPVSAVPVGLSGAGCTSTPYPTRTRPQSAAATKLASQGFAAAVAAAERRTEHRPDRPTSSPGHSYHIGRLVGRGRVAHMAAAAQARNQSPPKRALSAGHSAPILRPARPEAAELPFHGGLDARGRPSSEKLEGGKCVFEEIIRTDEFFGSILKEIKASYNSSQQLYRLTNCVTCCVFWFDLRPFLRHPRQRLQWMLSEGPGLRMRLTPMSVTLLGQMEVQRSLRRFDSWSRRILRYESFCDVATDS